MICRTSKRARHVPPSARPARLSPSVARRTSGQPGQLASLPRPIRCCTSACGPCRGGVRSCASAAVRQPAQSTELTHTWVVAGSVLGGIKFRDPRFRTMPCRARRRSKAFKLLSGGRRWMTARPGQPEPAHRHRYSGPVARRGMPVFRRKAIIVIQFVNSFVNSTRRARRVTTTTLRDGGSWADPRASRRRLLVPPLNVGVALVSGRLQRCGLRSMRRCALVSRIARIARRYRARTQFRCRDVAVEKPPNAGRRRSCGVGSISRSRKKLFTLLGPAAGKATTCACQGAAPSAGRLHGRRSRLRFVGRRLCAGEQATHRDGVPILCDLAARPEIIRTLLFRSSEQRRQKKRARAPEPLTRRRASSRPPPPPSGGHNSRPGPRAVEAEVLLLDEPLSNLDAGARTDAGEIRLPASPHPRRSA